MFHNKNRINFMMDVASINGTDMWINSVITDYICKTGKCIPVGREDIQVSLSASKISGLFPDQASKRLMKIIKASESLN